MNRLSFGMLAAIASLSAFVPAATQSAFALVTPHPDDDTGPIAPDGSNWGAATQASAPLGDHASSTQAGGDQPTGARSGLGNLAQAFGSWCGLLEFLGSPC